MNWRNLCLGILLPSALLMGPRVVCAPTVSGQLSKAGLAYDIEPSCAACGKRGGFDCGTAPTHLRQGALHGAHARGRDVGA